MSQNNDYTEFLGAKRIPDENMNSVILIEDKEKSPMKNYNNDNEKKFERNYERNFDYRYRNNYQSKFQYRYTSRRNGMFKNNPYKETIEERILRHYILDYAFSKNNIEIFKESSIKKENLDNIFLVTDKKQEDFYKDLNDFQSLVIRLFNFMKKVNYIQNVDKKKDSHGIFLMKLNGIKSNKTNNEIDIEINRPPNSDQDINELKQNLSNNENHNNSNESKLNSILDTYKDILDNNNPQENIGEQNDMNNNQINNINILDNNNTNNIESNIPINIINNEQSNNNKEIDDDNNNINIPKINTNINNDIENKEIVKNEGKEKQGDKNENKDKNEIVYLSSDDCSNEIYYDNIFSIKECNKENNPVENIEFDYSQIILNMKNLTYFTHKYDFFTPDGKTKLRIFTFNEIKFGEQDLLIIYLLMCCNINFKYKNIIREEIYDCIMNKKNFMEEIKNKYKVINFELIKKNNEFIPFLLLLPFAQKYDLSLNIYCFDDTKKYYKWQLINKGAKYKFYFFLNNFDLTNKSIKVFYHPLIEINKAKKDYHELSKKLKELIINKLKMNNNKNK